MGLTIPALPAVPANLPRLSGGHYGHGNLGPSCLYGGPFMGLEKEVD